MRLSKLMFSEIAQRKTSFALGTLAIAVATGTLIAAICSLRAHDARTQTILLKKERETEKKMAQMDADIKKAMEHLGFNMIILPKNQETANWYTDNYASKTMPEEDAQRLVEAKIPAISKVLPVLRKKFAWPETNWSVILAGEGKLDGSPQIKPGQVRLGHEIHKGLKLKRGENIKIDGQVFQIVKCLAEQGDKDDVTIWMNLGDTQKITSNAGLINEIHVREYRGGWQDLVAARNSILKILPNTRIVEQNFEAAAKIMAFEKIRERSRNAIESDRRHRAISRAAIKKFSSLITAFTMLICIVWLTLLATHNVQERTGEIALLRSIGFGIRHILALFSGRLLILALAGGTLGYLMGGLTASACHPGGIQLLCLAILTSTLLTFTASLWPVLRATQRDPAATFQEAE